MVPLPGSRSPATAPKMPSIERTSSSSKVDVASVLVFVGPVPYASGGDIEDASSVFELDTFQADNAEDAELLGPGVIIKVEVPKPAESIGDGEADVGRLTELLWVEVLVIAVIEASLGLSAPGDAVDIKSFAATFAAEEADIALVEAEVKGPGDVAGAESEVAESEGAVVTEAGEDVDDPESAFKPDAEVDDAEVRESKSEEPAVGGP
jgi:hypothetical protein